MASQGPNAPSNALDANNNGGTVAWTNVANALTSNDVRAFVNYSSLFQQSHDLRVNGFGFSIPSDAIIDGIEVVVEQQCSVSSVTDDFVTLVVGGFVVGANRGLGQPISVAVDRFDTYGGPTDLWSASWTPADINDVNFSVEVAHTNTSGAASKTSQIDSITMKIYYHLPDPNVPIGESAHKGLAIMRGRPG